MADYHAWTAEGMRPDQHGQWVRAEDFSLAQAQRDTAELVIKQHKPAKNGAQSLVTPESVRAMHRHDKGPFHSSLGYWDGYNGAIEEVARLLEKAASGVAPTAPTDLLREALNALEAAEGFTPRTSMARELGDAAVTKLRAAIAGVKVPDGKGPSLGGTRGADAGGEVKP